MNKQDFFKFLNANNLYDVVNRVNGLTNQYGYQYAVASVGQYTPNPYKINDLKFLLEHGEVTIMNDHLNATVSDLASYVQLGGRSYCSIVSPMVGDIFYGKRFSVLEYYTNSWQYDDTTVDRKSYVRACIGLSNKNDLNIKDGSGYGLKVPITENDYWFGVGAPYLGYQGMFHYAEALNVAYGPEDPYTTYDDWYYRKGFSAPTFNPWPSANVPAHLIVLFDKKEEKCIACCIDDFTDTFQTKLWQSFGYAHFKGDEKTEYLVLGASVSQKTAITRCLTTFYFPKTYLNNSKFLNWLTDVPLNIV